MKTAILGDIHRNIRALNMVINTSKEEGANAIIQVGDFGFYGKELEGSLGKRISAKLDREGVDLYFIGGNHEDWDYLSQLSKDRNQHQIADRIFFMPTGSTKTINGRKYLFIGGAVSIDREYRLKYNLPYSPLEKITPEDVEYIKSLDDDCDVVISHDAPDFVDIPQSFLLSPQDIVYLQCSKELLDDADDNRRLLSEAIRDKSFKNLFHGHYHGSYNSFTQGKRVIGLDKEFTIGSLLVWDEKGSMSYPFSTRLR